MNTKALTALVLSSGLFTAVSFAQTPSNVAPAAPSASAAAVAPDQIIYAPQLPNVGTLTNAAAAQGLAIKQISQTDREIEVTYQLGTGQTRTISYQLLPANGASPSGSVAPSAAVIPAPSTAPTVVYAVTDPYPYYYGYGPYYSGYWYPPVSVRLGFGWGYRGGHWR